jgi:hypothetical protein
MIWVQIASAIVSLRLIIWVPLITSRAQSNTSPVYQCGLGSRFRLDLGRFFSVILRLTRQPFEIELLNFWEKGRNHVGALDLRC